MTRKKLVYKKYDVKKKRDLIQQAVGKLTLPMQFRE